MNPYTVTVDYGATGEGRTLIIYYVLAHSKEDALEKFSHCVQGGSWYAHGAEVVEGFDSICDIADLLITPGIRDQLNDDRCNRNYLAQLHYNYS